LTAALKLVPGADRSTTETYYIVRCLRRRRRLFSAAMRLGASKDDLLRILILEGEAS
jgi:hypothetical protein